MYKIAVIGCGVIGMTSALTIQEELKTLGKVTIFTEEVSPNTTGDVSAGLWCPYLLQDTNIDDIIEWSKITQRYFVDLWRDGFADEAGVCLQTVVMVAHDADFKYPDWAAIPFGCNRLSAEHLDKINRQLNKNYKMGFTYVSTSCDPSKFLPFSQKNFIRNGGEIKIMKITDFSQLSKYDVIVNCTGVNSRELAKDDQVVPVRGQIVRVKAPWQFQTFVEEDKSNCVIANYDTVVLGGTKQEGDSNLNPDDSDTKSILEECYRMVPALKSSSGVQKIENHSLRHAPIITSMVGLRPTRTRVRLELETKRVNNKNLKIVHNYGHGGSGVTLSYGCALTATKLVKQALNVSYESKL